MDEFTDILVQATANVDQEYFLLNVHGADPVYRERVYCYELYHQMRCLWPQDCPYYLNGEVDKQRHPYFEENGSPKPDFLVHVPGTDANYAVVEVKARDPAAADMRKDVQTLLRFCELGYESAVYLMYGNNPAEMRKRVAAAVEAATLGAFELWIHPLPGEPAVPIDFG